MTALNRLLRSALAPVLVGAALTAKPDELKMTALPIRVPFDLTTSGSRVELPLELAEYRVYQIMIEFTQPTGTRGAWMAFIGTGQQHEVRAETVGTDRPVVVEQFTEEEQAFLASGGRIVQRQVSETPQGKTKVVDFIARDGTVQSKTFHLPLTKWQYTTAGAGVSIPLRLRIERLQDHATLFENTLQTAGTVDGGTRRAVLSMPLRPGGYAVDVENVTAQSLPPGTRAQLLITYNPKVVPADK